MKRARLQPRELAAGEPVWVVGLSPDSELRARSTEIASVDPLELPLSRTMRFRDSNIETAQLVNPPLEYDGVLSDAAGEVLGLWSSFAYENGRELAQDNRGVPIDLVADMLDRVRTERVAAFPRGGARRRCRCRMRASSACRRAGRSTWHSTTPRAPGADGGAPGGRLAGRARCCSRATSLLAIDGNVVTRFREVEHAVADKRPASRSPSGAARGEQTLEVPTAALAGHGHRPRGAVGGGHAAGAASRHERAARHRPVGVYVAYFAYGSPATRYGLYPGRRIVEVDGVPTPDLDAFLKAVIGRPDRSSVRLKTITWNNAPEVITLKLDKHYWPAYELGTPTAAGSGTRSSRRPSALRQSRAAARVA